MYGFLEFGVVLMCIIVSVDGVEGSKLYYIRLLPFYKRILSFFDGYIGFWIVFHCPSFSL